MNKTIGLDLGYDSVKAFDGAKKVYFPSVAGTPDSSSFDTLGSSNEMQVRVGDKTYNVGESAIGGHSHFSTRIETRDWYKSPEYLALFYSALSEFGIPDDITIVTGLPVAFFKQERDKEALKNLMQGIHHIYRTGKPVFNVNVMKCLVMPQPAGSLADYALSEDGQVQNPDALKRVGVIDIGGHTTNFLEAEMLKDVPGGGTDSINTGGWDAVRYFKQDIDDMFPDNNWDDHEIARFIRQGYVEFQGNQVDITEQLNRVLDPMADGIANKALELWPGGGSRLHSILISGGGANLIGERIMEKLPHGNVKIVYDSTFANARGYYKLGLLKAMQG